MDVLKNQFYMKKHIFFILFFCCFIWVSGQETPEQKDVKVGLVLSGGGAKGLAHIGVLKVLEEAGVRIDYIGGTSMGAIIGSLYAAGYSANELDSIFKTLDFDHLIQDQIPRTSKSLYEKRVSDRYAVALPFKNFKIGVPLAFSKGQNIYNEYVKLLYPLNCSTDFSKLSIPFLCVATDVETGEAVVLEKGYLPEAIAASGSFPSLFDPVEIDGRLLTDGGVVDNYPIEKVKEKGMDIIIGVDVQSPLASKDKINSALGVLLQISNFSMVNDMKKKVKQTDVYIKPDIEDFNVISFDKGNIIIENGKKAALTKIDTLKAIAKLQKQKNSPQSIPQIDSIHIKAISFDGNNHYTRSYLKGKLRIDDLPAKIAFNDFERGISNLSATNNFTSIRYKISQGKTGDIINFKLIENPQRMFIKLGVHYDNLYKTGFLFNLTKHSFLQYDDVISLDVILGDNLRYQFDYFVDKGYYISYGLRSKYTQFYRKINANRVESIQNIDLTNINKLNIDLYDITNQIYIQTLLGNDFVFGFGVEHKVINVRSETVFSTNDKLYFENSNFGSSYGYLKFDNLDNRFYPKKGFFFDADFHLYLLGSGYDEFKSFSIAKAKAFRAFPVSDKFTVKLSVEGGIKFGSFNVNSLSFLMGGYGKNLPNNIIPFYGYDYVSFGGGDYLKSDLTLDFNFYKKHHLLAHANIANAGNNLFKNQNWISAPDFTGYALGYGIDSFIGPIELKWTYSPEVKQSIWFFNVGFWF